MERSFCKTQRLKSSQSCLFLFATFLAISVAADKLQLVNGDELTGELKGISSEIVEFETEYAGVLRIKQDTVANIETEADYFVIDATGQRTNLRFDDAVDVSNVRLARLDIKTGSYTQGLSNRLTASLSYSQGNATTQVYVLTSESQLRRTKSEHILSSLLNYDVAEGNLLKNHTQFNFKSRRFLGQKNFLTLVTDAYRDPLKATDLRLAPVVGFGRNLWEHSYSKLTVETGIAAVYEWRDEERIQNPGWSWELSYNRRLLGGRVELNHDHRSLKTLGEGILVESSNEFKYKLTQNLDINLLARFKHDTNVPDEIEETDITYVAGIGLSF